MEWYWLVTRLGNIAQYGTVGSVDSITLGGLTEVHGGLGQGEIAFGLAKEVDRLLRSHRLRQRARIG
jgi:hypothetical protein